MQRSWERRGRDLDHGCRWKQSKDTHQQRTSAGPPFVAAHWRCEVRRPREATNEFADDRIDLMPKHINRRNFLKSMAGATIAPYRLGKAASAISLGPDGERRPEDLVRLKTFDYDGVRLLGGMFKKQHDATRDFYFNIP